MDQIFAPWRIDWVERGGNDEFEDCVFCELPDVAAPDREYNLLARGEHAFVLLNNYPYNPGHAMVIPHEHTGDYRDLDAESLLAKERLVQRTIDAMDEALDPNGYNVGYNLGHAAAGGSIGDHLHAHIVPRWQGDTNFMPVIGDTTVIVEAVNDTYDRLHEALAAQDGVTASGAEQAVEIAPE
ncbi:HIT family protein [Halovenus halobia]|uniref:HIT family protein n=1 Tax=Halovenus halobia TaxID=3396622 RepID=UPI003F545CBA